MTIEQMKRWAWDPDRNANETFEDIADWFQAETIYLRPGKSYPLEYEEPPKEERTKAWGDWREQKAREFLAGLEVQAALADMLAAALVRIKNPDWRSGAMAIKGNADLPGCTEFYKGYNAGIETQFASTQKIAEAALAKHEGK